MTKIDINIPNLRLFVGAIRQVVETLPEAAAVDLKSINPPSCGTPGCHAGLAMLALDLLGVSDPSGGVKHYRFNAQARRLSDYLLPGSPSVDGTDIPLESWADENPDEWGGEGGLGMFAASAAFGMPENTFPSSVIADWWTAVLDRLEERS